MEKIEDEKGRWIKRSNTWTFKSINWNLIRKDYIKFQYLKWDSWLIRKIVRGCLQL